MIKIDKNKEIISKLDREIFQSRLKSEAEANKIGKFQIFRAPVNPEFAHLFIDPGHPNEVSQLLIARQIVPLVEKVIQNP